MGAFSNTPALVSGGTIRPHRFVVSSTGADNTGLEASNATAAVVGVSDGSTRRFDSANHAVSGDPINLQGGDVVLVECNGNITRGSMVQSHTDGTAVVAGTSTGLFYQGYVALESGAAGRIIRIQRVAGFARYA